MADPETTDGNTADGPFVHVATVEGIKMGEDDRTTASDTELYAAWCRGYGEGLQTYAEENKKLRECLKEIRRDIEESADDVVWMRGGIETVCDRITAVLRYGHEQQL